jgi:hypothetical protein
MKVRAGIFVSDVKFVTSLNLCRIWIGYEELYLMGYNALKSVERQPTFRSNTSPSSSWFAFCLLHACFLLGLLLHPEDGGDVFLWNVGWLSTDCTALYRRTFLRILEFVQEERTWHILIACIWVWCIIVPCKGEGYTTRLFLRKHYLPLTVVVE